MGCTRAPAHRAVPRPHSLLVDGMGDGPRPRRSAVASSAKSGGGGLVGSDTLATLLAGPLISSERPGRTYWGWLMVETC